MIPTLTDLEKRVKGRGPKKMIHQSLESIVGGKLEDWAAYDAWHQLWAHVVQAGDAHNQTVEPELLTAYRSPIATMPLKRAIARTAMRLRLLSIVPELVVDLADAKVGVREFAYRSIHGFFTEKPPAFDPKATKATRTEQIEAIRAWVSRRAPRTSSRSRCLASPRLAIL